MCLLRLNFSTDKAEKVIFSHDPTEVELWYKMNKKWKRRTFNRMSDSLLESSQSYCIVWWLFQRVNDWTLTVILVGHPWSDKWSWRLSLNFSRLFRSKRSSLIVQCKASKPINVADLAKPTNSGLWPFQLWSWPCDNSKRSHSLQFPFIRCLKISTWAFRFQL